MDIWTIIQIVLVVFFVFVPIAVVASLVWVKRVIDENREMAKKELELWSNGTTHGRCDVCSEPIRKGFQFCPVCHKKHANKCPNCGRFLKLKWTMCPYCGEPYGVDAVREEQKELPMK